MRKWLRGTELIKKYPDRCVIAVKAWQQLIECRKPADTVKESLHEFNQYRKNKIKHGLAVCRKSGIFKPDKRKYGEVARGLLMLRFIDLPHIVVRRMQAKKPANPIHDYNDLVAYGNIGLMNALNLFEPGKDYAYKQAVKRLQKQAELEGQSTDDIEVEIEELRVAQFATFANAKIGWSVLECFRQRWLTGDHRGDAVCSIIGDNIDGLAIDDGFLSDNNVGAWDVSALYEILAKGQKWINGEPHVRIILERNGGKKLSATAKRILIEKALIENKPAETVAKMHKAFDEDFVLKWRIAAYEILRENKDYLIGE